MSECGCWQSEYDGYGSSGVTSDCSECEVSVTDETSDSYGSAS